MHGTINLGWWYPKRNKMSLISYSNVKFDKRVKYDKPLSKNDFCKVRRNLGFIHVKDV